MGSGVEKRRGPGLGDLDYEAVRDERAPERPCPDCGRPTRGLAWEDGGTFSGCEDCWLARVDERDRPPPPGTWPVSAEDNEVRGDDRDYLRFGGDW
jgi:hypothetical protein